MQKAIKALVISMVLLGSASSVWAQDSLIDAKKKALTMWEKFIRADVDLPEAQKTKIALAKYLKSLPNDQKVSVAIVLITPQASDEINSAVLEMFGQDGLPIEPLKLLLEHKNRPFSARTLLRIYSQFVRKDYETALNEKARLKIVGMVADYMEKLCKDDNVSYGEQRLMTHMLQAILTRYTGKEAKVKQYAKLLKAMREYVTKKRVDDTLAASIKGWLTMIGNPRLETTDEALIYLGHWDESVRRKAGRFLAKQIMRDKTVAKRVIPFFAPKTADIRDEARAAAINVFNTFYDYNPKEIVPMMIEILTTDRGVVVQKAAADSLIGYNDPSTTIRALMEALVKRKPGPGPKRASQIFETLSYLITDKVTAKQKKGLTKLAVLYLDYSPEGALKLLQALGSSAKSAIPAIEKYRNNKADRYTRHRIDNHVLPAIDPKAARKFSN